MFVRTFTGVVGRSLLIPHYPIRDGYLPFRYVTVRSVPLRFPHTVFLLFCSVPVRLRLPVCYLVLLLYIFV